MNKLIVSSSPHIKTSHSTPVIMFDVLVALLPVAAAGVFIYGFGALLVIATCVITAVACELLFNIATKKAQTVCDLSAVITGLILALNLRADTPIWQCILGSAFAIVVVKCFFGGLGSNFANPAATARIFLLVCFSGTIAGGMNPTIVPDLVATATPIKQLVNGGELPSLLNMFLGFRGGAIGEACILVLVLRYLYLVARKVIHFETPLITVGTVFVLSLIVSGDFTVALYQVLSGGLVFGAVFMVTDYVTSPITRTGKMIFAFGVGLLTFLIRNYTGNEGVSYAIVLMNILSPYIEGWTQPKAFGKGGNK